MSETQYERCPHCGSYKNVVGKQSGYADIMPMKMISLKSQPLYHVICEDCGTVIRSFVKKPEALKLKK